MAPLPRLPVHESGAFVVLPDPKTTVAEQAARALPGYDPKTPAYYDQPDLKKELDRVYDVCHTCRLCFNLCGSFPALFDAVDRQPQEVKGMTEAEHEKVVDECYQCKICYVKCPYTPPHQWQIDFPRLMLRADANRKRRTGFSLRDRLLGAPEVAGEIGLATWPISNWMNEVKAHRWLFEKLVGVHRDKKLPPFAEETFADWFRDHADEVARETARRSSAAPAVSPAPVSPAPEPPAASPPAASPTAAPPKTEPPKVVFFWTCYVNWNEPEIGKACVRVLEQQQRRDRRAAPGVLRHASLDQGDVDAFLERARENVAARNPTPTPGSTIVVPQPTAATSSRPST